MTHLTTDPESQKAIDKLLNGDLDQTQIDVFVAWIQDEGWDECVSVWEKSGEPVVFNLQAAFNEFANDSSLEEHEDVLNSQATDDLRVEHFRSRIQEAAEDPSSSFAWSVHMLPIRSSAGKTGVCALLVQLEGYEEVVTFHGVFESSDDAWQSLTKAGFRKCDSKIEEDLILSSWNKK